MSDRGIERMRFERFVIRSNTCVHAFHRKFGYPMYLSPMSMTTGEYGAFKEFRTSLIREEYKETVKARGECDVAEVIDGLCDLVYVVQGTVLTFYGDNWVTDNLDVAALYEEEEWTTWQSEKPPEDVSTDFEVLSYRLSPTLDDYVKELERAIVVQPCESAIATAGTDVVLACFNAMQNLGVPIEPFWEEVQRTNMAKEGGPKRADGKLLKPVGWTPPNIKGILEEVLKFKRLGVYATF